MELSAMAFSIGSKSPSQTAATIRAPSCVDTSPDRPVDAASDNESR